MPCVSDYTNNSNNCSCNCQPIEYHSTSSSSAAANFNVPTYCDKNNIVFTATDFSQQLASGVGREVSFAAFLQMGSSLANAAQAMIVLALDQCNTVLNANEALIATPTSSSSTTKTTIYHQTVCACDQTQFPGATDQYIYTYVGSDGKTHESISYVDKNGKEVGSRDFIIGGISATSGTLLDSTGAAKNGAKPADGDIIKINGQNFILKDSGKTDNNGNKIFNLDISNGAGNLIDTGVSVGTISFTGISDSKTGALTISSDAVLDYDSNPSSAAVALGIGAVNANINILVGPNSKINLTTPPTDSAYKDAYTLYESLGKGATLSELGANGAPATPSVQTNVTDKTTDPLSTMAAVFKYAEVYAEAMTMISTYYQNNIDAYKNRPH